MNSQPTPRVIIGVQDSVAGLRAVRCGMAEARLRLASVHLLRAYPTGGDSTGYQVGVTDRAAQQAWDVVCRAIGGVPADLPVQVVAVRGAPGPALVGYADGADDIIVVGDGQRAGLRRVWSGSVARHCVRHALCPVLVVPPPALARSSAADVTRAARRLIDAS